MIVKPVKRILSDIVVHLPEVKLAYLFGSRVRDDVGPLSDYDFAVLAESSSDGRQVCGLLSAALTRVLQEERIHVVLLNAIPIELAYSIIAQGELLYECDVSTRVEYEARVMGLYGDYLPILRAQRRDILEGDDYETRVYRYRETLRRTERTLGQIRADEGEGPLRL